ncbi:MAG: hypothetical protein RLZZ09_3336, partial [Pseudomonadota bacterium]
MPSLTRVYAIASAAAVSTFMAVIFIAPSLAGDFYEVSSSQATAGAFSATGLMTSPRSLHTANLLTDGRVLLAGGVGAGGSSSTTLASAELYDPITRTFGATSAMSTPRLGAASVRLNDGRVFMAGGEDASKTSVASVGLYNPVAGTWTLTSPMKADRVNPTATLLGNGQVLVVGGYQGNSDCCALASAELYDPKTGTFSDTGSMATARRNHTATLLEDGKVLIAGGYDGSYLDAPELYDPATGTFSVKGSMGTSRRYPTATLLLNGDVLIAGGSDGTTAVASAELYEASGDGPVKISTVAVSNPGNAVDTATQVGAVDHEFRMGQFDITIGQYTAFLNAVGQSDPHGLYNPKMATDLQVAGIARTGSAGKFRYSVIPPSGPIQVSAATPDQRPITYVSWFDAARFANWMTNGQPSGRQTRRTTENGAYNLLSTKAKRGLAVPKNTVNPNTGSPPIYFLPTENEWYKAAYYNPALNNNAGGYTLYSTNSNS